MNKLETNLHNMLHHADMETVQEESPVQEGLVYAEIVDGLPVIPGYAVTTEESDYGTVFRVTPTDYDTVSGNITTRYAPEYIPEGWIPNVENNAKSDELIERNRSIGIRTFAYELWYNPPIAADGSYPITDFYIIMNQNTLNLVVGTQPDGTNVFYASTQFIPISIGDLPGFIAVEEYAADYIQYTVCWEQDGYLFKLETSNITENYLEELLHMAQSVRPIE